MKIDIKHIAKLANLRLKAEDETKFEKQLNEIVSYVEKLNEVDTKNIDPTSQVTGLESVYKNDDPQPSLSQEEVLQNAKDQHNGLFKVKAIFDPST